MLNHRFVTAVYAISIGSVFLFIELGTVSFYFYLLFFSTLYLLIEFAGAYLIGLNFHLHSINQLSVSENKIALTFDDGPAEPHTSFVLDVLKKYQVKATFFVIGKNMKGNETVLKRMVNEGHAIGSHSYSHHFWIDLWGRKKLEADITQSILEIKQATGQNVKLFRPPYGVTTPGFEYVLKKLGLQSIGWNVRSYDTSTTEINKIFDRVLRKTKNGSIILLHDRLEFMPELLEKLIPALKAKQFEFVLIES